MYFLAQRKWIFNTIWEAPLWDDVEIHFHGKFLAIVSMLQGTKRCDFFFACELLRVYIVYITPPREYRASSLLSFGAKLALCKYLFNTGTSPEHFFPIELARRDIASRHGYRFTERSFSSCRCLIYHLSNRNGSFASNRTAIVRFFSQRQKCLPTPRRSIICVSCYSYFK